MKSGPRSPQLEKALAQKQRPNTVKYKNKLKTTTNKKKKVQLLKYAQKPTFPEGKECVSSTLNTQSTHLAHSESPANLRSTTNTTKAKG